MQWCDNANSAASPAPALQEHEEAEAEAINCSSKGQGCTAGAITSCKVKQHGLELKLFGSFRRAGQGLFKAQRFSALHHRVIDLLAASPFTQLRARQRGLFPCETWSFASLGSIPGKFGVCRRSHVFKEAKGCWRWALGKEGAPSPSLQSPIFG